MKKVFHILIASIILASGIRVGIDHHYCGGQLAETKISLTGKLASCGMETCEHESTAGLSFEKRCCEDKLAFYGIVLNYMPEEIRELNPSAVNNITITAALNSALVSKEPYLSETLAHPPGDHIKPEVDLSLICSLRI